MHGFLTMESKSEEGHVGCKCHIAESSHTILSLKQAFPVGFKCHSAWWVFPIQVGIKNINGLLVDSGFKFTGEERGSRQLLLGVKKKDWVLLTFHY